MTQQLTLETLQSLTHDQLARRLILLGRVNATAMQNAERFSNEAATIAALARAIRQQGASLIDRIAMIELVERIATTAESDAALDRQSIEYFCACPPQEWDEIEARLIDEPEAVAQH